MLYTLLQISDSLFPAGAFAHSCGLEGLLAQACAPDRSVSRADGVEGLQEIVASVFTQHLLYCDGLFGVAAHRALRRGVMADVCTVDRNLFAMKVPRELREASVGTGHSFLAEVVAVVPHATLRAFHECVAAGDSPGTHSVAFHAAAAAAGIAEDEAALAWGYQSVAQMAGTLMRLGALGHRGAQALLAGVRPVVEAGVRDILTHTVDAPSSFAPHLEIASMRHERQYSRLFRS